MVWAAGLIAGGMALGTCTGADSVEAFELAGNERASVSESTSRVTLEHLGPGLLRIDLQPHSHITKTDGELASAWVRALADVGKVCVLLDLTGVESVSKEAVEIYSGASRVAAFALLGSTAVDKVIAHGLRGLDWPGCPVEYFTDEGEALAWLQEFC